MSAERAQAVQVTLAELRRAGGHQRGLAGRLARTHGVNERTWARAVTDARAMYAAETTQDKCEAPPPGAGPAVQARLQAPFRGGLRIWGQSDESWRGAQSPVRSIVVAGIQLAIGFVRTGLGAFGCARCPDDVAHECSALGGTLMIAASFFFFVVAVLALLVLGLPFLLQAPLRKRGVQVMASEVSRTIPRDGKIDVQYGYLVKDGGHHTVWRRGVSTEPAVLTGVVYDPNKPKRADFNDRMPENVQRRRIVLLCLTAVAVVMLVLMAVGTLS